MRLLAGFAVGGADGADQAMASTTHSNAIDVAVAGNGHDSDARIGTLHIGRGGRPSECGVVEGASEPRAGVGKEIEITELAKGDGRGQNPSSSLTAPLRRPAVTASSWPRIRVAASHPLPCGVQGRQAETGARVRYIGCQ